MMLPFPSGLSAIKRGERINGVKLKRLIDDVSSRRMNRVSALWKESIFV
jgi:hypothetical protein